MLGTVPVSEASVAGGVLLPAGYDVSTILSSPNAALVASILR